jgi:glutamyl-tRNA(Gln) amidotransferase subunit D
MDEVFFTACDGTAGLIVEGTGLGHVHTDVIPVREGRVEDGTTVVMTSQCLDGRVCDRVYDTGRDLLDAGVVEGEDMLPGTAKVKLMWVLANTETPADAMARDLAGEITERSVPWE